MPCLINKYILNKLTKNMTNKIVVQHIDNSWGLELTDMIDYGTKNNGGKRYILVVVDNFSRYGWRKSVKNKSSQTIKRLI